MNRTDFDLTQRQLITIAHSFCEEILKGCKGEYSSLDTLPTYFSPASGDESGLFIGLDLGGTNFRVLLVELDGKTKRAVVIKKVSQSLKAAEMTSENFLFDSLAESVIRLLKETKTDDKISIGFTFSFPLAQLSKNSGRILRWAKSFSIPKAVGQDPAQLLEKFLIAKGVTNTRVAALINDTTGTVLAGSFFYPNCSVGTILGTGTNCCVALPRSFITKPMDFFSGETICVNLESGNFNQKLPRTPADEKMDNASLNPSQQPFEKMVSGLYLGQIVGSMSTEDMSEIEKEDKNHPLFERIQAVSTRSSKLAAAAIAGSVLAIDPQISRYHTVAVDGSLFEKYPKYSERMKSALSEIFGQKSQHITLRLVKDGSGIGAAIAAAISQNL